MSALAAYVTVAIWGGLLVYPVLQYIALRRLRGRWWRAMAILPLIPMAPVLAVTLVAILQNSNMWPIWLIFVAPLALLYLGLVLLLHRLLRDRFDLGAAGLAESSNR